MNAVPNFITTIDGLDFHFLHVRSKHEQALPLLLAHGWPGSVIERMKVVDALTDPTAHGGDASDAFHLVVPSLPGFGFSGKPTTTGWNPVRVADAYVALMDRLGYEKYGVSGTDWGAITVDLMALKAPGNIVGLHTNMGGVVPPDIDRALARGDPPPGGLSEEEQRACEQIAFAYKHIAYAVMMGDRPQSLTALADSPVGLAAFMIDLYPRSYEMIARSIDGAPEGLTPDDVLDSITLVLADEQRAVGGADLLGKQDAVLCGERRRGGRRGQRVPRRTLRGAAELVQRRRTRSSCTTTACRRAATFLRGNSRCSSRTKCAPRSER